MKKSYKRNKETILGVAFVLLCASLVFVFGYHYVPKEDVIKLPHSVVSVENNGIFSPKTYAYYDESGAIHNLNKCELTGVFSGWKCSNNDGTVVFSYIDSKGSIAFPKIEINGIKLGMKCNLNPAEKFCAIKSNL